MIVGFGLSNPRTGFNHVNLETELERLEAEMKSCQAVYERLTAESPEVLEETRLANPHVSSDDARNHVE